MVIFALALQLICCGDRFPSAYDLELPKPPSQWVSLLGDPHWRVEWLNPNGEKQSADISPGGGIAVEIPITWANPVTAWPFWPSHNLIPGLFKPAGALFPLDVDGDSLRLSWEAGADTVFYWELALANKGNMSRAPANLDWLRFRSLFKEGTLKEDVCKDPWLIDWRSAAEKTIASGFDRRRFISETPEKVNIPVFADLWYGASPFAEPLCFDKDEGKIPVFPVRSGGVNVWVSEEGILRVRGKVWVFKEWK